MIHREALGSKQTSLKLEKVLETDIQVANSIKIDLDRQMYVLGYVR